MLEEERRNCNGRGVDILRGKKGGSVREKYRGKKVLYSTITFKHSHTEPESAYDCVCSAAAGTLTTYDGTALNIPFGAEAKQLGSRWAADGNDPCKYQLRVITENAVSRIGGDTERTCPTFRRQMSII